MTILVDRDVKRIRRLLRAKDRMDAAPHEDWPITRLAEVSGTSEAYFARSFRAAFGIPPHRYLLTRRVERAVALLRDTDLAITEIAFQAGWNSLGTFCRTFRDITGEPPAIYASGSKRHRTRLIKCRTASSARRNVPTLEWQFRRSAADRAAIATSP
ncbi:helix-turn-helix transcriptional regulator [Caulobacter segnis]|uniref:helix-turn-helix transcriptional regulator n=1 Tax=Caulobacter segnis TaxID=88688 RepID=UPI0028665F2A|nr:helix-turn-helix transcriptional regulator [Caulobacter segnis]MDR6626903.1 AraC-like DNA-binding protein [Caulobacter segnis]